MGFKPSTTHLYPEYWPSTSPSSSGGGGGGVAETDTILKTEKPLGKDQVTAMGHEQKVTTGMAQQDL